MKQYLLPVKIVAKTGVTNGEALFCNKGLYGVHDQDVKIWEGYTCFVGDSSKNDYEGKE